MNPKRAGVWICLGEEENKRGGFCKVCIRRKVWVGQQQALLSHAKEQSKRKRV